MMDILMNIFIALGSGVVVLLAVVWFLHRRYALFDEATWRNKEEEEETL